MRIRTAEQVIAELLEADPLRDFFTWWDRVLPESLISLETAVNSAKREEDMQLFLQNNPTLLIQQLGGGHGRWVIPKPRLKGYQGQVRHLNTD